MHGAKLVAHHKRNGMNEDDALVQALVDQASRKPGEEVTASDIDEAELEKLRNHVRGWRGSSRRQKRRRGP